MQSAVHWLVTSIELRNGNRKREESAAFGRQIAENIMLK